MMLQSKINANYFFFNYILHFLFRPIHLLVAMGNAFSKWATVKANRCHWNRNANEGTLFHHNDTQAGKFIASS